MALYAVPAKREFRTYTQPDGTQVTAMLVGDEFGHSYFTTDGVRLMSDGQGTLRYASIDADGQLVLSSMAAANPAERTAQARDFIAGVNAEKVSEVLSARARKVRSERTPEIRKAPAKAASINDYTGVGLFTSNYPRTGKVRSLVFLVQYTDVKFTIDNPQQYYTDQLNKEGFSEYGATGSARDFFLEQSHGQFDPTFDVYGPITLANKQAYYGGNDWWGNDMRPEEMVSEAVEACKNIIDYSQYDFDNDGYIDNVYVIYAGLGEADSEIDDCVWPHTYEVPNGNYYNGKKLKGYACSNEISDNVPVGIGTFCHEYSHVLGLPDLYPTQTDSYNAYAVTPNTWSIMDQGSYNNNTRTPPAYSSFERNALGWLTPTLLTEPASISLEAITSSNTAYLVPTVQTNEFFLIENRQQEGNDKYLPYHGMLIWHIDFNQSIWDRNIVNDTYTHNRVDIVEAGGSANCFSEYTLMSYSFPGTKNVTSFTSSTTPAFKDWYNKAIDMPLTNIKETNGVITFDAAGGRQSFDKPAAPAVAAQTDGTLIISWNAVAGATRYDLSVWTLNGSDKVPFRDFTDKSVGNVTSYKIEGIESGKTYYAAYRAASGNAMSEYSDSSSADAPEIDFIYTAPTAVSAVSQGHNALLSWDALKGAESYAVTVNFEIIDPTLGEVTEEVNLNFGDANSSAATIPADWTWSGKTSDIYKSTSVGYFGASAPSLKFSSTGTSLTSPVYPGNIQSVQFWFRGANVTDSSVFDICGRTSEKDNWTVLLSPAPMTGYNADGAVLTVTPAAGTKQIRFVYTNKAAGNVAFDDLKLTYSTVDLFNAANRADAGNELSYTAAIPANAARVSFFVEGVDAQGRYSMPSNTIDVALTNSGITAAPAASDAISIDGLTVRYTGTPGDLVSVYTLTGTAVVTATADSNGCAAIALPSAGMYIISTPAGATKAYIK